MLVGLQRVTGKDGKRVDPVLKRGLPLDSPDVSAALMAAIAGEMWTKDGPAP